MQHSVCTIMEAKVVDGWKIIIQDTDTSAILLMFFIYSSCNISLQESNSSQAHQHSYWTHQALEVSGRLLEEGKGERKEETACKGNWEESATQATASWSTICPLCQAERERARTCRTHSLWICCLRFYAKKCWGSCTWSWNLAKLTRVLAWSWF